MNDEAIEQAIADNGLNAPRITPERIEEVIVKEDYHVFEGTTVTVCMLTLANGYSVIGSSACASPENFDAELGRKIARGNARDQVWALEGYLLCEKLYGMGDG
jgi:hypothetical protein